MNAKAFFFDAHGVLYYRPKGDSESKSFLERVGLLKNFEFFPYRSIFYYSPMILTSTRLRRRPSNSP